MEQQFDLVIDLAVAFASGSAGYRKFGIALTGEVYWFFPHAMAPSGWWLIPARIQARALRLNECAIDQVIRRNKGRADTAQIVSVLRQWKRTGSWRRHVCTIVPRTSPAKKKRETLLKP